MNLRWAAAVRSRRFTPRRWAGLLLLAVAFVLVVPQLRSGTEMVRARNALSLGPDLNSLRELDWTPANPPVDYRVDRPTAAPYFAALAGTLQLSQAQDDWARAMLIGRHLLSSAPRLNGGAIHQAFDDGLAGRLERRHARSLPSGVQRPEAVDGHDAAAKGLRVHGVSILSSGEDRRKRSERT